MASLKEKKSIKLYNVKPLEAKESRPGEKQKNLQDVLIENGANAFVKISYGEMAFILDPWIKSGPGVNDGGWDFFPEFKNPLRYLKDITHIYISHLHQDHCDPEALKLLPKHIPFYIPNVFGSIGLLKRIESFGFTNIKMIKPGEQITINSLTTIEVIGPMNSFGQEFDLYSDDKKNHSHLAIDTGLLITINNKKLIFLADNTPYHPDLIEKNTLKRLINSDLLAFPYNGAASDYPVCYQNISPSEIIQISEDREKKRKNFTDKFIRLIKPKNLLPYSSDFSVIGPAARKFALLENCWWMSKNEVGKVYSATHKIPSFPLHEEDKLILSKDEWHLKSSKKASISLKDKENILYSDKTTISSIYTRSDKDLNELTDLALKNMFSIADKFTLKSDWVLDIQICDTNQRFIIDFKEKKMAHASIKNRKILKLFIESAYYEAILTNQSHWNYAQGSFQLVWERSPNEYCHGMYTLINFFHTKRN